MSKFLFTFAFFTIAQAACFGSYHLFEKFENVEKSIHCAAGSCLMPEANVVPMSSVLATPNVVYEQDESELYFLAFFDSFYTITCLEGDYYGFQAFVDDNDETFAISDTYHFEEMDGEEMMVHEYGDGQVYTGKAIQIIHIN